VAEVTNAGLLFTDNQNGVSGTDAGFSIPMEKHTLWIFGDVFLLQNHQPENRYIGALSNCAALVPKGVGTQPLRNYRFLTDKNGIARPILPNAPHEDSRTRLWPMAGWYEPASKTLYTYYAHILTTPGGGPFDFKIHGYGLAAADASQPQNITLRRIGTPTNGVWWPPTGPLFGSAVVTPPPGPVPYRWILGWAHINGEKHARLARVPAAQPHNPEAYQYWAGEGNWDPSPQKSVSIPGLHGFPNELTVSWNPWLRAYLAVHQVGITEKIRLSAAQNPWGPYQPLAEIGAPHRAFEKAFCYAAKEHPELAQNNGRTIYITYVDSQRYWLQLLKVELRKT
jgi:hypothetical protein